MAYQATGTRRIPISSSSQRVPPNARQPGGGGGGAATTGAPWQSSLDLVFSFSRSQAFFGSNLPTSPSFVARYRRPGFPDDESSAAPSERGDAERTTSEDGTRGEESVASGTEEEWSEDEIDRAVSWDAIDATAAGAREQLPRNAVAHAGGAGRKSSRSRSKQRLSSAASVDSTSSRDTGAPVGPLQHYPAHLLPPATERSPLIRQYSDHNPSKSQTLLGSSPPDSAPFPRRTPLVSAALLSHAKAQNGGRRMSIIDATAWKDAVEASKGLSTYGQTLFNTVNVLVGVGLLAEPLAFADAGWALGTILLLFCALITNYTAKMLARLMSQDPSLKTYTDVLIKAYGQRARTIVHLLFVCELGALSIALVTLFSDSMSILFPRHSSNFFKLIAFFVILPTTYIPLRFLSITSLIGILSSVMLFVVVLTDGIIKRYPPGSLWVPETTSAGPRWGRLPLSFGLLMSGFAGHAVIPSLYRDMKDPHLFNSMINTAYVIAFSLSMVMGALGYVMFGNDVSDEVTRDLRLTHGYPQALNKVAVWMIAINPVVKYALAQSPLASTLEHLVGLGAPAHSSDDSHSHSLPHDSSHLPDESAISIDSADSSSAIPYPHPHDLPPHSVDSPTKVFLRLFTRPLLMLVVVGAAIAIPNFGIVLSFLGSSSAFVICAIGPIGAYLILGSKGYRRKHSELGLGEWEGLGRVERGVCWVLLVVSVGLAVTGTVWVFLPGLHDSRR